MSQTKAQLLNPLGDLDLTGQLTGVGATFTGNITAVDGIFSGNVSVAGTLTKEDVTNVDSVGLITARSGIEVTGGDITIPDKIVHRGDTNTAIRFPSNDTITFETNGDQALEITSGGGVKYQDADSPTSTTAPAQILNHSGGWQFYGSSDSGTHRNIIFGTNNAAAGERLRITSQGSVGINSTSPVGTLDVTTTTGTGSTVFIYAANHNTSAASQAELRFGFAHSGSPEGIGYIKLKENGTNSFDGNLTFGVPNNSGSGGSVTNDVLTIKGSNQNVGIGTDIPQNSLHIEQPGGATIRLTRLTNSSGNAQISFSGTNVNLANNGGSSGNILFSNDGSERLRIGSVGQIGIAGANYGNAGQVLTSGGSGSSVSWVDAAGGAEFAGIASGSISTGDPVMVHPDGKLEKVENKYTEDIAIGGASNGDTEIGSPGVRTLYWPDEDGTERYLFLYRYSMSSYYRTATRAGNSLTLATRGSWAGQGAGNFAVGYNPDRKRAVTMFYQQSPGGYCAVRVIRPSGTTITGGSTVQVDTGGSVNGVGVAYHGDDKFIIVWSRGGTVYSKILTVTSSSSWTGISLGSTVTVGSAGGNIGGTIHISEKDSSGKHMLFYPVFPTGTRYGGFGINYAVISVSGTTPSFGSISHLGGSAEREYETDNMLVDSSFDSSQNRYLVVYKQIHDGTGTYINKTYVVNAAISGTSITMSSQVELTNNISETTPSTAFDSNLKKHFVFLYSTANSNSVVAHPFTFTGSAAPTAGSTFNIETGDKVWFGQVIFSSTVGKLVFGARNASSSGAGNWLRTRVVSTSNVQTNLKRENFLGFSKGNYSDGNTAKVNVNGSVDENQSSLTPGETYFVQEDGTISLTSDKTRVVAGQAASSTNLIVRDENPRQGILGFWQFHLYNCGAYKPWCACRYVGGYSRNQNGQCNFCTGAWRPWCCNTRAHTYGQQHVWDVSDENGGNVCIGCGGQSCGSQYCVHTAACNASCPDGRFWFPSNGLYCYNFNMMWLSCQQGAAGGCWNVTTLWNGRKCHNNACAQCMWDIQNWRGNPNVCNYCDSRMYANNIQLNGMVSVPDKNTNFILWKVCDSSLGTNIKNNGLIQCEAGMQCFANWVSFTKLSNYAGVCYCN